jgi:hypothetical protein
MLRVHSAYHKGVVERRVDVGNAKHLLARLDALRAVADLDLLDLNIVALGGSFGLLALRKETQLEEKKRRQQMRGGERFETGIARRESRRK